MSNPWLKKNPFMSIWLSTANRMAAQARTHANAQLKRQISAAVTEATNENLKLMNQAAAPKTTVNAKRRRSAE